METKMSEQLPKYQINKCAYYATEAKPEDKPILSFLMCVRFKGNIRLIHEFFESFMKHFDSEQQKKVEFLIKFDVDDEYFIEEIFVKKNFEKYPFIIRPYFYRRWESRHCLNLHYMFLFSRKAKTSQFVMFATDDCVIDGNFLPTLEKHLNQPYCIFTRHTHSTEKMIAAKNYRVPKAEGGYLWSGAGLTEPFPIVSSRIIECAGNMGWQVNIDNWLSLLNIIMYTKYKVNLMIDLVMPNIAFNLTPRKTDIKINNHFPCRFNMEMFVSTSKTCENDYYFDLTERQAKNIYLNMVEEGFVKK